MTDRRRNQETAGPVAEASATGPEEEDGGGGATAGRGNPACAAPASLSDPTAEAIARFVNLIDREWVASCLAQEGCDPGIPAERALADPHNRGVLDRWLAAIGHPGGTR